MSEQDDGWKMGREFGRFASLSHLDVSSTATLHNCILAYLADAIILLFLTPCAHPNISAYIIMYTKTLLYAKSADFLFGCRHKFPPGPAFFDEIGFRFEMRALPSLILIF